MACCRWLCGLVTGEVDPVAAQRDRLRIGAAVLGAVAVLAVVGRITGPEAPASRSQPTPRTPPTTTPAPPQQLTLPERWATARIEVAHGGGPLVFGAGSLWVGAWRDGQVVRVDPRSNRVVARFPAGGRNPAGLAVGAGSIWVVHPDTDEVVRLDPGTGRVVARIKLGPLPFEFAPGDRRFLPSLVAVGAGAGWVATGRGAVARIDLASNRVVAVIKLPPESPAGIAVAGRTVWVAAGGDGVARIEAATNRLLGTIRSTSTPSGWRSAAGRSGSVAQRPTRLSRWLVRWRGSTPPPAASGRSSQLASRSAWRPPPVPSWSRSRTLLAGRWNASSQAQPPRACPWSPPWESWPSAATPCGSPTAAGRRCTEWIPTTSRADHRAAVWAVTIPYRWTGHTPAN
jgi:hypothetical protein